MGYMTFFDTFVVRYDGKDFTEEEVERVVKDFEKISYEEWYYDFRGSRMWLSAGGKWYDCEEDMKKYTEEHPEYSIIMYGDGEESEDKWLTYFRNGKSQVCMGRTVYDDPGSMVLTEDGLIEKEIKERGHPFGIHVSKAHPKPNHQEGQYE